MSYKQTEYVSEKLRDARPKMAASLPFHFNTIYRGSTHEP